MRVELFLTSVPHSGTTFFKELLHPHYICHLYNREKALRLAGMADIVACAIRRPEDVWASWWRRGYGHLSQRWREAWEVLAAFGCRGDVHWLPIDHAQRAVRLADLGTAMGRIYDPDWSVRKNAGVQQDENLPPPQIDLSEIYAIPIVKALYGGGTGATI